MYAPQPDSPKLCGHLTAGRWTVALTRTAGGQGPVVVVGEKHEPLPAVCTRMLKLAGFPSAAPQEAA